jgi:hypothetical protein
MKKSTKVVVLVLIMAVAYIGYTNLRFVQATYNWLMTSQWLWLILLSPVLLLIVYKIGQGTELFGKFKFWKWMVSPKEPGLIPQEKREHIAKEYLRNNWFTRDYIGSELVLVDNQITPIYPKAVTYEVFYFTPNKAYADRRIGKADIPSDQRFFVVVNCLNGEAETRSWDEMQEAYDYALGKFMASVPKIEQELPPQMKAMQEKMWEGLGLKIGEKAGEKSGEEKPQQGVG